MAGRRPNPHAPARTAKRLAAALEPPARGSLARALSDTVALTAGLGVGMALVLVAHLELAGAAALAVKAGVVLALGAGLAVAARRLRARIEVVTAVGRGLDALGEAVLVTERDSLEIIHASPAAERVYGRPVEELLGADARALARPQERAQIDERVRLRAAGHRLPGRTVMPLAHPGPEPRWVEWASVSLTVGASDLLLNVARDVTPTILAEQRLAEDRAFLEAVFEAAAHPIVVVAADGRLLRANAAAARLAERERDAMLGRAPWELGLMTVEQGEEVARALRGGADPVHHVTTWRTSGGERIVAWAATAMRDAGGHIRSAVSVGRDLTGQRVAEDRARRAHAALDLRSRELRRSNADLAEFAALVATDLREPIRAVAAFGDLLQADAGERLDARGRTQLAALRGAAGHAEEMLDGLVAYGGLRQGEALARDVDCESALDAALAELAEEIEARDAVVTRDPLPVVPGDPDEVRMLLGNLVANAVRFGGAERPRVHVGAERRGLGWQLTVADDGNGVPEGEREHIFRLFGRLDAQGAQGGRGVGLALCRRIAERHGGAVWVDDAAGGGSVFRVSLPDREAR